MLRQTQLSYILFISIVATSFDLRRPSSGQNTYKNYFTVMGSHDIDGQYIVYTGI
jgi:hypothetical protein